MSIDNRPSKSKNNVPIETTGDFTGILHRWLKGVSFVRFYFTYSSFGVTENTETETSTYDDDDEVR